MKLIKKYWSYLVILVMFMILGSFIPLTNADLTWANLTKIVNIWSITKGSLVSSMILLIVTKFKIIRVIFFAITGTITFIFMRNIVNKKNDVLTFIGLFLFLLLDNNILNEGFISTTGYIEYFIGTMLLLIITSYIANDNLNNLGKVPLFILGFISMLIKPIYSITIFILTLVNLIYNKVKKNKIEKPQTLFLGSTLGLILFMYGYSRGTSIIYVPPVALNVIENVIPSIYLNNFIIAFVSLLLLLFLSCKVFLRGNIKVKILDILSIACLSLYAFTYLLDLNIYFKYVAFILNMLGSYYILMNTNNSMIFKKKIRLIYLIKIIYLVVLSFSIEINYGNYMIVYMLDILIILEILNYLLPNNFFKRIWLVLTYSLIFAEIYLYANVYYNFNEMNLYIKHHLECNDNIIILPSRYETEHLYDYIPNSSNINSYIKYYDINYKGSVYIGIDSN